MSDTTKTAILKIEIDQKSAAQQLLDSTKNVLELRKALDGLNDAYKKGKVDVETYAKQKIELDAEIKKESQSIKILTQATAAQNDSMNQQKAILAELIRQRGEINRSTEEGAQKFNQLNTQIKSLNESLLNSEKAGGTFSRQVGNYKNDIKQFAEGVEVGELSLGRFISRLSFLVNPAVAAASAITALGAAYTSSASGGKDLEETQNRLKAQWQIFAGNIGGEIGGGEGLLTKTARGIGSLFDFFGAGLAITTGSDPKQVIENIKEGNKQIDLVAESYNKITELQFEQMQNEVIASKQRKEAYELVQLREDKERTLNERLETANTIVELQKKSVENNVEALKKQAGEILKIGELTNNNVLDERNISELRKSYLQLLVKINAEESARARRISQAEVAAKNITNEITKQNEELAKQNRDARFGAQLGQKEAQGDLAKRNAGVLSDAGTTKRITDAKLAADSLKKIDAEYTKAVIGSAEERRKEENREAEDKQRATEKRIRNDREAIRSLREISGAARTIWGQNSAAYKAVGTTDALISTYVAADRAIDIYGPTPVGYAAMAAAILTGLANVKEINKAAGGGTFETKGPTMLLVGDNPGGRERIDVTPLSGRGQTVISPNSNLLAMAGGGSLYTNGGLVTGEMGNSINNEFLMNNIFKNMPQPVISWKEGLIVDARVKFKEALINR